MDGNAIIRDAHATIIGPPQTQLAPIVPICRVPDSQPGPRRCRTAATAPRSSDRMERRTFRRPQATAAFVWTFPTAINIRQIWMPVANPLSTILLVVAWEAACKAGASPTTPRGG
jgi:hypothetical protein